MAWLLVAVALAAVLVGDGGGTIAGGAPLAYDVFFVVATFALVRRARARRGNAKAVARSELGWRGPVLVAVVALVAGLWPFVGSFVTRYRILGDGLASLAQVANWRYALGGFAGEAGLAASPFRPLWATSLGSQLAALAIVGLLLCRRLPGRRFVLWCCALGAIGSAAWVYVLGRFAAIVETGDWPLGIDPGSLPGWLRQFLSMQYEPEPIRILFGTDTRASALFVGVAAAVLAEGSWFRRYGDRGGQILGGVAAGVVVVLVLSTTPHSSWLTYGSFLVTDALVAFVLLVALHSDHQRRDRAGADRRFGFAAMATLAYSVFAWHGPFYALFPDGGPAGSGILAVVVRIGASLGVGALWALAVEPAIRHWMAPMASRRVVVVGTVALVVVALVVSSVTMGRDLVGQVDADGRPNLVFAGDSMPYILGLEAAKDGIDTNAGFHTYLAGMPGCGITGGELQNYGHGQVQDPACQTGPTLWRDQAAAHQPRVSVLLSWGWELYDRKETTDGGTRLYAVGTPEWYDRLSRAIQGGIDALTVDGGKVVLLTLPCVDADIDTATKPNTQAAEQWRVAHVNRVVREAGAANPDTTAVLDLAGYLCPNGHYRARMDGVPMSEDSVHFTWEGARKIWQDWLAPQLREMVDAPAGAGPS